MFSFKLDHYAISVSDMEQSLAFYKKLGFDVIKDYEAEDKSVRIVHTVKDDFILELFCYPDSAAVPAFVDTVASDLNVQGSKHLGLMASDLEAAADYVIEQGLATERPQINQGRLGRPYFFIKDPDGIFVEIIAAR